MISESGAFFALDLGSATTSAALLARLDGRWRLVAHDAVPSWRDADTLVFDLLRRVGATDPELLTRIAGEGSAVPLALAAVLPRLESRSTPPRRLAILAGSRRQLSRLEQAALGAGWIVSGGCLDEDDPVSLARLAMSPRTDALVLGADRSPNGDERKQLPELVALVAAAVLLRPELTAVLAGGAAAFEADLVDGGAIARARAIQMRAAARPPAVPTAPREPGPEPTPSVEDFEVGEPSVRVLLAPDAEAGEPVGSALGAVLEGLRALPNDSRIGLARSAASLAAILGRTVEIVEVGLSGGLRAVAQPPAMRGARGAAHHSYAEASFVPPDPSDEVVDGVAAWLTVALDRHRLIDRLLDLRVVPWGDAEGDGAIVRLAAARAALGRLFSAERLPADEPLPEMLVGAGGILASLPPEVAALALADLVRRPGVGQLACDHARLLGPLGVLEDETERRVIMADLAEEILLPLGGLVVPAGLRAGRAIGSVRLGGGPAVEMRAGSVSVLDLAPGRTAEVELEFRDQVNLPTRGRHFRHEITGGLAGVLVDLRDVPMRLPDRAEARRAVLDATEGAMWPERDS